LGQFKESFNNKSKGNCLVKGMSLLHLKACKWPLIKKTLLILQCTNIAKGNLIFRSTNMHIYYQSKYNLWILQTSIYYNPNEKPTCQFPILEHFAFPAKNSNKNRQSWKQLCKNSLFTFNCFSTKMSLPSTIKDDLQSFLENLVRTIVGGQSSKINVKDA
jgi:hypothetical protein